MSVFDEIREKCPKCNGRINHWDQTSCDVHDSGECVTILRNYWEHSSCLKTPIKSTNGVPDYLLDLDYTLADI
jgi:hypothetical protein